jgi:hypothetical protein
MLGDDLDFANEKECQHYSTIWLDYIEDKETNEEYENNFEKCVDCGEIFYDE